MKTILFVHQSAEMYGSDKVLLSLASGLDRKLFTSIVMLPENGPLKVALDLVGVKNYIVPLVKVSRATFSLKGLLSLPGQIVRSYFGFSRALGSTQIDVVHSNTLAVLSGALWAKLHGIPHVWHVHEMIVHPTIVRKFFPWLLLIFADRVVCNSYATENLLIDTQPRLKSKTVTIWNGMDREQPVNQTAADTFRQGLGLHQDEVLIVLMGRINRWKGQMLLVDAAEIIAEHGLTGVRYLLVGSPPEGQEFFLDQLEDRISKTNLVGKIKLLNFQSDIWPIWDAADIAVVPSTEPEPFGMVALEAMASLTPVIVAAHGGLLDIVVDGESGLLVRPNCAQALADALINLISNQPLRIAIGRGGYARYEKYFSLSSYVTGFEAAYIKLLEECSA